MSRWFRMYDDALDHPKVQRLPPVLFKAWVNLLCLASRNDGALPCVDDMAFALRTDADTMAEWLAELTARGLLDDSAGQVIPHNWQARQFKSDKDETAAERQARKRSRDKENSHAPVTRDVTPPRAEAETETETTAATSAGANALDGLESKLREAANATANPSPSLYDLSPVRRCLSAGASLDMDVLPTIRAITARPGHRWQSWAYAERAIMDAKARREAPPIEGQAPKARAGPGQDRPLRGSNAVSAALDRIFPDGQQASA